MINQHDIELLKSLTNGNHLEPYELEEIETLLTTFKNNYNWRIMLK